MEYLYGNFEYYQIDNYKDKLHNDIFWLILYKDPKTEEQYLHVDFNKYFVFLMKKINGLNELLFYPKEIIELLSYLQAAYQETKKEIFDWKAYRKLIFDAQSCVNKIGGDINDYR